MTRRSLVGEDLLTVEGLRSYWNTQYSVGLLWTSDQLDIETSIWQHTTLTTERYQAPGGIQTHHPSKGAAANPRHRPSVATGIRSLSYYLKILFLPRKNKSTMSQTVTHCRSVSFRLVDQETSKRNVILESQSISLSENPIQHKVLPLQPNSEQRNNCSLFWESPNTHIFTV